MQCLHKIEVTICHHDVDSCPADSILPLLKSSRLKYVAGLIFIFHAFILKTQTYMMI